MSKNKDYENEEYEEDDETEDESYSEEEEEIEDDSEDEWSDEEGEEDEMDDELEDIENEIQSQNNKKFMYVIIAIVGIVVLIGVLFINAQKKNAANKQEEVVEEVVETTMEENPDDVSIDNVAGDLNQVDVSEEVVDETQNEDENQSNVSTTSEKNREQSTHQYPSYPADKELVQMDMESLEIYNVQGSGSYVTIFVGDINGNRAHINIDKSMEGCNDDLNAKLSNDEKGIMEARLDNFLNANSNSNEYDEMKENYIKKYIQLSTDKKYVLEGYKSDYKHSSLKQETTEAPQQGTSNETTQQTAQSTQNTQNKPSTTSTTTKPTTTSSSSSSRPTTTTSTTKPTTTTTTQQPITTPTTDVKTIPIEYVLDGGTNNDDNLSTITTDAIEKFTLKDPTKEGYHFIGWYTDSSLTKAFDKISKTDTKVILYAKWNRELSSIIGPSNNLILNKDKSYNIKDYITTSPVTYIETLTYKSTSDDIVVDENGNITMKGYHGGEILITSSNNLTAKLNILIDHTHDYSTDDNSCKLCGSK